MRALSWMVLALLAFGLAVPARAQFLEKCVANDGDLADAILGTAYIPTTIMLVQGTYHVDATSWFEIDQSSFPRPAAGTSLRGGYTANCVGRNIEPGNTVLAEALLPSTSAFGTHIQPRGDFTIEGLTIQLPHGLHLRENEYDLATDAVITLRRNALFNSGQLEVYWVEHDDTGGTLRLLDNLVVNSGSGGCALFLATADGMPSFELINNTIVEGNGVCFKNHNPGGDGHAYLSAYNNIFYDSSGFDFESDNGAITLVDNIIGSGNFPTPVVPPTGTLNADPKLDANFRPIESLPSPTINSGTNIVPGGLPGSDLDGGPRVIGTTVDRGACESNIDDASFKLVVTNNHDSGPGSLREAILSANANQGFNFINFAIGTGCGPHVITLTTPLPAVTADVLINGYSQAGAKPNTLEAGDNAVICIVLESGDLANVTTGLRVPASAPGSVQLTANGLGFAGFHYAAIDLRGGGAHIIGGNAIGSDAVASAVNFSEIPVGIGVRIGAGVNGVLVGGDDPASRNIIGEALANSTSTQTGNAIVISGPAGSLPAASGNQVLGNHIGTERTSSGDYTAHVDDQNGVYVAGFRNTISGNVISYSISDGVRLDGTDAHDNVISSNQIAVCDRPYTGNGRAGVMNLNAAHDNRIHGNAICNNGADGVRIVDGQHNKIIGNSIFANTGLGIDIAANGIASIDNDAAPQTSTYANRGQNFPAISSAAGGHDSAYIGGTLSTTPGTYTVQIFRNDGGCDASGNGEGETLLATEKIVVPQISGLAQVTEPFSIRADAPTHALTGTSIAMTATDAVGDTSEFSKCVPYVDDTIFADGFERKPAGP